MKKTTAKPGKGVFTPGIFGTKAKGKPEAGGAMPYMTKDAAKSRKPKSKPKTPCMTKD